MVVFTVCFDHGFTDSAISVVNVINACKCFCFGQTGKSGRRAVL
jgi:hypothetical protein